MVFTEENSGPPPTLRTARLTLRAIASEDIPALVRCLNTWAIAKNLAPTPYPYTEADAHDFLVLNRANALDGKSYSWAMDKDGQFIGSVAIGHIQQRPEGRIATLGYYLDEPFWNRGYTTEAARAALDFAFEQLACSKVISNHAFDNPASGRVLAKLGFSHIANSTRFFRSRNAEIKSIDHEMDRTDWSESKLR